MRMTINKGGENQADDKTRAMQIRLAIIKKHATAIETCGVNLGLKIKICCILIAQKCF